MTEVAGELATWRSRLSDARRQQTARQLDDPRLGQQDQRPGDEADGPSAGHRMAAGAPRLARHPSPASLAGLPGFTASTATGPSRPAGPEDSRDTGDEAELSSCDAAWLPAAFA